MIETGCKTVIGSRLKQSGMFWAVRGAKAINALRCHLNVRRLLAAALGGWIFPSTLHTYT
ncbi:MAG: hypothetical protein ABSH00_10425 [Bryobacteraceae bacterium]